MKLVPFIILSFLCISCNNDKKKTNNSKNDNQVNTITDSRDGQVYKTISIANKVWMAENLRYNTNGSIINPNNPSKNYGRLYTIISLKDACPKDWHLPSDKEWDALEIAHGMPTYFIGKGGWRGNHAIHMRAKNSWNDKDNNTNKLQFNILPAGYFASGKMGLQKGFEGLGYAAAFWSSTEKKITTARFMFNEKTFINKWEDKNNDTGAALSCRCIKN